MADDTRTETDETRTGESNITTDRETVRTWVEETNAKPAYRTTDADERELHVHHPDRDSTESVEEIEWDEFHQRFDEDEMALMRHGEGESGRFELIPRTEAIERATLDDREVEEALLEGETVTSEIVETKVIERTVQETETIESKIIDSEVVRDEVIDEELIRREISGVHIGERDTGVTVLEDSETVGVEDETLRTDEREEVEVLEREMVTLDVDETREVTREIIERKTVESRLVDVDIEETDTVESDTLESRVDLEGVQRTIVESDILGGEVVTEDVIEGGQMESEVTEDQTILTELYERRLVVDEMVDRKRLVFELVEEEVVDSETIGSRVVESYLVGSDALEEGAEIGGVAIEREEAMTTDGVTTGAETETTGTMTDTETTATTDTETVTADETTTAETESSATMGDTATHDTDEVSEAESGVGAENDIAPVELDDDDVGKSVIDANDDKVGVVSEVDEAAKQMYVDPHPGLAKRIKTRLGWEGHDEDDYTVDPDNIEEITDAEVRLRSL